MSIPHESANLSPGQRVDRLRLRFMAKIQAVYLETGGVLRLHLDDGSTWLASADDKLTKVGLHD